MPDPETKLNKVNKPYKVLSAGLNTNSKDNYKTNPNGFSSNKGGRLKSFIMSFFQSDNSKYSSDKISQEIYEDSSENAITEQYLIKNIVSLKDKMVQDIMIPRVDIVAADEDSTGDILVKLIQKSGFSRIPIYEENLDGIKGFVHAKDLIYFFRRQKESSLKSILRKVIFISPYMKLLDLLYEMRQKRIHLAIVVDEFGGVDGLITIEDIMEEIVGDITDEHDKVPEKMIKKVAENKIEVDARISLEELEEYLGVFLQEEEREEFNTLSGLIVSLVGYIPSKNELIEYGDAMEFRILSSDHVKINKVLISYDKIA